MDRKPVSNSDLAALGKFQGTIERNSNFRQQAVNHNLGRNVRVVDLLWYMALLRQRGNSLIGHLECVAAVRQNFSSSQSMTNMGLPTGPTQAAHFLPGQVRIGGREVWHFATNPTTRGQIEFLFAEVEHLPTPFNQADSAAEAKGSDHGLCSALARACVTIARLPNDRLPAGELPLTLIQDAYEHWQRDAITALTGAVANKTTKPGIPALVGDRFEGYTLESVSARSTASSTLWNREESLGVLEYYLEDQQKRTWQWVVGSCQRSLRDIQASFKG